MRTIIILPEGSKLRRSERFKSKRSSDNLVKIYGELINVMNNSNEKDKLKNVLFSFTNIFRCQATYYSSTDFDDNHNIRGLLLQHLLYNDKYGNPNDIRIREPPKGAYFPMKPDMLHAISANSGRKLVCNDEEFLKNHQCPGVAIRNVLYYPVKINNKVNGLLCFINRKNGFSYEIIDHCKRLVDIVIMAVKESTIKNQISRELTSNMLQKIEDEKDLTYYIINNCREIAIGLDKNYKILSVSTTANEELTRLFGGNFVRGNKLDNELIDNNNARDVLLDKFQKSMSGEILKIMTSLQDKLGNVIYWDCFFSPIYKKDKIVGCFLMAKNISDIMILQEELRLSRQEAINANKMKDEYISRISHELRTPLNSIIGFGQLLMNNTDEVRNQVKHILTGGNHLLRLINDVLDISSIEAGTIKLSIETINIYKCITENIDLLQTLIDSKKLEVVNNLNDRGDIHRINQIIINILSNAIKYNKTHGSIIISGSEEEDHVIISIKDTGIGISPDYMGRLFIPFDRLDINSDNVEGTGLGLALCKSLIEKMGGSINITSTKNIETLVKLKFDKGIKLASTEVNDINNIMNTVEYPKKVLSKPKNSIKILYIEDNVSNYELMESIIRKYLGYELICANMGSRGYEIAISSKPDLILLDLGLPDISGEQLLIKFKGDDRTKDIPIIVNSAYANKSKIDKVLELGASHYITKPFNVDDLLLNMKKFLTN